MSSIRAEFIALDTNQYVYAVRGDTTYPACEPLFFGRISELRIHIPLQVIIELNHNLFPEELRVVSANLRRAAAVRWDTSHPNEDRLEWYHNYGAKKGDAAIAAELETAGIHWLVSENRHFLGQIPNLPFTVLTAQQAIDVLDA